MVGIVTLVKDEQNFLEEWIIHNIKIGFDKIIIFEDIDSTSHKYITDKYSQVELHSMLEIDTYKNLEHAFRQIPLYEYITYDNNLDLDWCAFIDVDEFINGDFKDIHNLINYCDNNNLYQIWMWWTLMTCNGLVEMPSIPYNVQEVYTECNYDIINDEYKKYSKNHKVILNLHKRHIWVDFPHVPLTERNRCICMDDLPYNIEFRHYLSKSYEEYIHIKLNKDILDNTYIEHLRRDIGVFWYINGKYDNPEFKEKCKLIDKKYNN